MQRGKGADLQRVEHAKDVELSFLREIRRIGEESEGHVHAANASIIVFRLKQRRAGLALGMASTLDVATSGRSQAAPSGLTVTDLLLLCMAVIWGVNYAVVKFGAAQVDPLVFNSVRVVLAAVVLV